MVSSRTVLVLPVFAGESRFRRREWRFGDVSGVFAGESGVLGEKTPLPKTLVLQGKVALVA